MSKTAVGHKMSASQTYPLGVAGGHTHRHPPERLLATEAPGEQTVESKLLNMFPPSFAWGAATAAYQIEGLTSSAQKQMYSLK